MKYTEEDMEQAFIKGKLSAKERINLLENTLLEIRDNHKLWKKGGIGGQDQYAGLPPFCRLIDEVLNK